MIPNLDVLQKKCSDLGLKVEQSGKRPSKDDYVAALRKHQQAIDYPAGLPYQEVEPMLCFAEWNLKPEELEEIVASPDWMAEWKENGARCILHIIPGKGVWAHSRNVSVQSWRYAEQQDQFLPEVKEALLGLFSTSVTLDIELIIEKPVDTKGYTSSKKKGEATQSSLHSTTSVLALEATQAIRLQREQNAPFTFKVLDVIKWKGQFGWEHTLRPRLDWRKAFFQTIKGSLVESCFIQPKFAMTDKKSFLKSVLAQGGEGVIYKNLNSPYLPDKRARLGWVKAKKRVEFDAYVSGFDRGEKGAAFENLVGNLQFSIMTDKGEHLLGRPSNMTLEERKRISVYDPKTDTVTMIQSMYGRVAEISGQDISARELRLSHCTLDRYRDQPGDIKTKEECFVKMEDLLNAAEWVG